jgi:fused signal recognition particle receptor
MGIFDDISLKKLRNGLEKTRTSLIDKVTRLVKARTSLDGEVIDQLEEILISADVGVGASLDIIQNIHRRVKEEGYTSTSELDNLLKDEIKRQFATAPKSGDGNPYGPKPERPYVLLIVGINGAGKTTTIGKLAHQYVQRGMRVTIGAADTFRAAANEQLSIWSERAGATIIQQSRGSDPAAVAFDAVASASAQSADVVIIDTAGRLHTKVNLMEELKKIKRVIAKHSPYAPHEVLLVIDASTGQNGLQQAKRFDAAVGITGLVITKLDGTAKGGIVLAISREMNVPVRFIGVGEKLDDLQPFDAAVFVDALFGTS